MRTYIADESGRAEDPPLAAITCDRCKLFYDLEEMKIARRNGRKLCVYCTDKERPHVSFPPTL